MTQPPSEPDGTTPESAGADPGERPAAPTPPPPPDYPPPPAAEPPPAYGTPTPPGGYGAQPQGYGAPPPPVGAYGQPAPGYAAAPYDPQAKSKIAAGLLGIFLGGFGVHRFYLGYTKIGVIQLIVTIVTCGIGSIWGFVEGILYLIGANGYTTDATGRPLRE
jgi:TM2 domain-containing membrane protein YozV